MTSNPRISHRRKVGAKLAIRPALAMVRALARRSMDMDDLRRVAKISRATFFRMIADLETELRVIVAHDESTGKYSLVDPGVLDLRKLK